MTRCIWPICRSARASLTNGASGVYRCGRVENRGIFGKTRDANIFDGNAVPTGGSEPRPTRIKWEIDRLQFRGRFKWFQFQTGQEFWRSRTVYLFFPVAIEGSTTRDEPLKLNPATKGKGLFFQTTGKFKKVFATNEAQIKHLKWPLPFVIESLFDKKGLLFVWACEHVINAVFRRTALRYR